MEPRQAGRGLASRRRPRVGPRAESPLPQDLAAVLAGDQAVYLQLGPEGAILSVKPRDAFAYGEAIDARWHRMSPEERAQAVLGWIRKAAQYCRSPKLRWKPA
jgi:hypothetical protein